MQLSDKEWYDLLTAIQITNHRCLMLEDFIRISGSSGTSENKLSREEILTRLARTLSDTWSSRTRGIRPDVFPYQVCQDLKEKKQFSLEDIEEKGP